MSLENSLKQLEPVEAPRRLWRPGPLARVYKMDAVYL